ncbi:MAG TPA: MFS transporter [Devosia sp.]|nr:MFS transporter [Devosia sp.]
MAVETASGEAIDAPPETWRRDNYIPYAVSRVLSALGSQGIAIAVGWLIYDKTQSAFDLGYVGLCQFLPMVILTFVVGNVADRFDRRRIALSCQIVKGITCALLTLGIVGDWLTVPQIFLAVIVIGCAQAFEQPTMQSLVPSIVPKAHLQTALSTTTAVTQTATIIGPSLAGALYGFGPSIPFALATILLLVASMAVSIIRTVRGGNRKAPVTLQSVFGGVSFIANRPVLLGVISLDLFAVLLGGVTALLPIFARDILHAGPWAFGALRSAPAIGGILMSVLITRMPIRKGAGFKILGAVAAFGVFTILFSLSTNIIFSVVALVLLGASDTISMVVRITLVQLLTPDDMRGRVNAVNSLFVGTSNQLGAFESGIVAGLFGTVASGVIGGIGTLLVVGLWMKLFPNLARIEALEGQEKN